MHGGKFAAELKTRLKATPKIESNVLKMPEFWGAVLWLSERRLFADSYQAKIPRCLSRLGSEPKLAAVTVHTILNLNSTWRLRDHPKELDLLRNAASTTRDPYYRFWFDSLVRRAEEELAKESRRGVGGFAAFADLLNQSGQRAESAGRDDGFWDEDQDDEEELLDFDPQCPCPDCTAAREAAGHPHPESETDHEQLEFQFSRVDSAEADISQSNWEPPTPSQAKIDIPRDPEIRRTRPKNPMAKKRKKKKR
jgi:hypothetical protein